MKLESQVCTLEQAKRLKELGVICNSIATWFNYCLHDGTEGVSVDVSTADGIENVATEFIANAYTVAELGVMLPLCVKYNGTFFYLQQSTTYDDDLVMSYEDGDHVEGSQEPDINPIADKNEVNLRARMLIYLLENGNVTAEEVNNRLTNS